MAITAEDVLMGPFSPDEALHLNGKCASDCSYCKEKKNSMPSKIRIESGPLSSQCKITDVLSGKPILDGCVKSIQINMRANEPVRASLELIDVELLAQVDMQEVVAHVAGGAVWEEIDLSRADAIVVRSPSMSRFPDEVLAKCKKFFKTVAPDLPVIFVQEDTHFEGLILQRKVSEELIHLRDRVQDLESQLAEDSQRA